MNAKLIGQCLIAMLFFVSGEGFASDLNSCQTAEGQGLLIKEYISSGGMAPACGPDCAKDFILAQVCAPEAKASCLTEIGRKLLIKEYVAAGNPVPACGPQCAENLVLSKVCPR